MFSKKPELSPTKEVVDSVNLVKHSIQSRYNKLTNDHERQQFFGMLVGDLTKTKGDIKKLWGE